MNISLIVATDLNNGIGKDNQLPWHLPADLKHFKTLTTGHPIIMGRKTYESIGKPLPNRRNIVISRSENYSAEGIEVVRSIPDSISLCQNEEEVFIIGGAQIFRESIGMANVLYLTKIEHNFEADTFFPELVDSEWVELEREHHLPDEKNKYSYTFLKYRRA